MATAIGPAHDGQGRIKSSRVRLLIIEDSPADAELALKQLRKDGFEIVADIVQTADEFRGKLATGHYDAILSDLSLPNWSGLDALEILKKSSLDLPFIMVTGTVGEETVAECLKMGATDYVLKDRPTRLPNAIRRALQERSLREERGRAQEQLLRLAAIVDSSDDAILGVTLEGNIANWNAGAERLYGYKAEEVIGRNASMLASPEQKGAMGQILERLQRGERVHNFETVRFRKDGQQVDVALTVSPIRDGAGRMEGASVIAHDIMERKRGENELRTSEYRYRRLFEAARDGILILDIDSAEIQDVNPYITELLGFSKAELLGKKLWEIGPFRDVLSSKDGFRELQSKEFIRYDDLPLKTRAGKDIAVEFVSNVYLVGDRKVIQCNIRDITGRKQAENSLIESNERFRATFENAGIGMALVDMQGRCIKSNLALRQMLGYSEDDLKRMTFTEFTHGDDCELDSRLYGELAAGKREQYEIEKRYLKKDGSLLWGLLTVSLVKGGDGLPVCAVGMVQDITVRKLAENELRLAQFSLEHASEGLFLMDSQGRILRVNEAAYRSLGYTREELCSMSIPDIDPLVSKEAWGSLWEKIKAQSSMTFETRNRTKSGRAFPVEISTSYLKFDGMEYAFAFQRDITERKRSDERLLEYEKAMEGLDEMIAVVDREYRYVIANRAYLKLRALTREQLVGKLVPDLSNKGVFNELVKKRMDECFQGKTVKFEVRYTYPGIGEREMFISYFPIEGPAGIDRIVCVLQDITERKQSEAERMRLMTAIEQAAEGVVVTDTQGVIQYVNPAFTAMTGYTREEALGQNTSILRSDKQDDAFYESMWATLRAGQVWTGEMVNRRKDGSLYTEKLSMTPVHDERGEITHMVAMKEDITARKLLEDQFRQAQKMEAVGRLAAGVAHDFNNLLTIIIGYSDVILDQLISGDPMRDHAVEIKKAGERAEGLTRQLLAFSRQQVLAPVVLDLNALIEDLIKMLKRLIGEDIDLAFSPGALPATVKADPGHIEQVLLNLAVNARDAMPRGGKLTIGVSHVQVDETVRSTRFSVPIGAYVVLAVTDTGCGMDKDTQAHIFEPFFTTKGIGKGTGLGLATVYGIVQQSGGHIWVYSEPGVGTTFKIFLPATDGIPESSRVGTVPKGGMETILLVEDDAGLRGLARMVLESRGGYKVLESSCGQEAQLFAAEHAGPIHLMLTDVVMPGISGRELSECLSMVRPDMKILFMSGYTDDTVVRHGVLEAGTAFIQKPFTPDSLLRKVRDVLDARLRV